MNAAPLAVVALVLVGCATSPRVPTFRPVVVDASDARRIEFLGLPSTHRLDSADTAGAIAMLEITLPPRTLGAPPHVHGDEDEFFYVLEGDVAFRNGDDVTTHGVGSVAALPRGHLHCFWNGTDREARVLVTIVPGRFDRFFDETVAQIRAEHPSDTGEVGEIVARVAKQYDCDVFLDQVPALMEKYGLR